MYYQGFSLSKLHCIKKVQKCTCIEQLRFLSMWFNLKGHIYIRNTLTYVLRIPELVSSLAVEIRIKQPSKYILDCVHIQVFLATNDTYLSFVRRTIAVKVGFLVP